MDGQPFDQPVVCGGCGEEFPSRAAHGRHIFEEPSHWRRPMSIRTRRQAPAPAAVTVVARRLDYKARRPLTGRRSGSFSLVSPPGSFQ